jgi:hypothetical protein
MGEGTGKGDGVIGALEVAVMGALGHRRSSKIKAAMEQLGEEREILGIGDGDEEGCTMHTKVLGDNLMHTKMQENTLWEAQVKQLLLLEAGKEMVDLPLLTSSLKSWCMAWRTVAL